MEEGGAEEMGVGGGREEVVEVVGLRGAGTLRFMFSSASRLSAWKSGWRNVQLYQRW